MSPELDPVEELLGRIVAGELDADAAEVRAMADEPDFEERLDEARRLARTLENAGEFERSVIAEADALEAAPGEERVLESVLAAMPEEGMSGPADTSRMRHFWVAAAAAFVIGFFFLRSDDEGGGLRSGETLGNRAELLEPSGTVQAYRDFRWSFALEAGGWYRVVVHDAETDTVVARSPSLTEAVWEPDDTASWPDRIRWEVQPFDGTGGAIGSPASGVVSRSRP